MSGSTLPSPGQPNRWPLLVAVLPGLAAVLVLVEAIHAGERQALKADALRAASGLAGALVAALGESSPPAARGESLAAVLTAQSVPPGWTAAVFDREGRTIARRPATAPMPAPPATAEGFAEAETAGSTLYVAHRRTAGDHAVAVGVPAAELRGRVLRALALPLLALIAIVFAASWIAWRLARRTGHAIGEFAGVARAAAAGDRTARVGAGLPAEFHGLAEHFNALLESRSAKPQDCAVSEASFRLLAENAADCIFWVAPDGRFRYVSPACETLTGYPPGAFLEDPGLMMQLLEPEDRAAFAAHLAARESDDPAELELRIRHRNGERRWIAHRCRAMRDGEGRFLGRHGHNRDITARREAEELVRKLSRVVEQSPASVLITDPEGRIEYVNQAFERTTGYTREEVLGRNPRLLESGRTPTATFAALWAALKRGESWRGEFINRRKDGTEYTDQAVVTPIRGSNGRIAHYVSTQQDVTEERRQAAELARHRDHLEDVVAGRTAELAEANARLGRDDERLRDMLALSQQAAALGEREILARGIETAERLTGSRVGYAHLLHDDQETLQLVAWTGRTLAGCSAVHAEHYPVAQAGIWADTVRTSRPVIHNDYANEPGRHGLPEGHFTLSRHLGVPVGDGGRVRLLLGVGNKAEPYGEDDVKQLLLVGGDLWRILTRRRLELELARAKEAAEAAARSKSAFLANMSHEIRTPMNAIIGLTHMMRRAAPTPEQADRLAKIGGAADHLLAVINDILDISKIEAGKLVLERADFDLAAMLARICSFVAEKARAKGLELVVDTDDLPEVLHGDATRLGQALLNYLGNAVKFADKGSIVLRARLVRETEQELLVRFEVEDNGIGIEPVHLGRLFQAFEQADNSTTRRFGGTGLGLAIARHLAELMGGEAGAESQPGVGSTFWLTARLGKPGRLPGRLAISALAGCRALVADDMAATRLVHTQLLRMMGLRSEAVGSGAAALEALADADRKGDPFALLVLDLHMPDLDGLDTLERLHRLALGRLPAVLLVTASGDPAIAEEARRAGCAETLVKPLTASSLHDALVRHLPAAGPRPGSSVEPPASDVEDRLRRDFPGTRILIAEDDRLNQEVAHELLGDFGWTLHLADDGAMAVEMAAAAAYDLILMDMQMPVLGGLEATRAIRQMDRYAGVPILAMTANAFHEDRERCLAAGMDDFVAKPVNPDRLYEALWRWLDARERPRIE